MTTKSSRLRPFLSLIIPAYKQEKTIMRDLQNIKESMDQLRYSYEIIVVVDGTFDRTFAHASKLHSKNFHITGYPENRGKGYAIRFGTARAKGEIVGFLDAGMDLKVNGLAMLLEHFEWYNADVIIGSKLHPVSKVNYPFQRKMLSWGYRLLTKILFGLSVRDTQVGMKFFKKKVLQNILPRMLVKTYAFDIEMLAVAYYLGYTRIYEAPIELNFNGVSSITSGNFWKTIYLMLWDTLAVFYRLKIMHYYDSKNRKNWHKEKELNFHVA